MQHSPCEQLPRHPHDEAFAAVLLSGGYVEAGDTGRHRLEPGDVVVLYSDGVTDARSPSEELYDSREVRRLLKRVTDSPGSAEAVGKSILQDIREFSLGHRQADDITLVCFGPTRKAD